MALATGLLIGRWWAPLPFLLGVVPLALALGLYDPSGPGHLSFLVGFMIAWAVVALIGVGVRVLLASDLARIHKPTA